MAEDNPKDLFKFVSDDVRGGSLSLEDVLVLAGEVEVWKPIFSGDKETIVGYSGMRVPPGYTLKYFFEVKNELDNYRIIFRDEVMTLADIASKEVEQLFNKAKQICQKSIDKQYKKQAEIARQAAKSTNGGY